MLSANMIRSHGYSGLMRFSRSPRLSASWMLAACTTTPSSSPSVSTATWRLRPFSRFAASQPRGPPLSVVLTLWVSMIVAVGLASRPAPSRSRTTKWWRMLPDPVAEEGAHVAVDGLFTNDKFCFVRRGSLALPWRRGPFGADRKPREAGLAVPGGLCPLGAGHEAPAVDGQPTTGRPSSGTASLGQGLSATPAGGRHTSQHDRHSGRSTGRFGGEPSCK